MSKDAEVIRSFLTEKPLVVLPSTPLSPEKVTDADVVKDFIDDSGKLKEKEEASEDEAIIQPAFQAPKSITDTVEGASRTADTVGGWLKGLPTPGGIGAILLTLLFFVWVIVPVNEKGDTRFRMLWGVLTGQYGFKADYIATTGPTGSDFGEKPQSEIENDTSTGPILLDSPLLSFPDFGSSFYV